MTRSGLYSTSHYNLLCVPHVAMLMWLLMYYADITPKDTMRKAFDKFGLDQNTIDFVGHALCLYRDDSYVCLFATNCWFSLSYSAQLALGTSRNLWLNLSKGQSFMRKCVTTRGWIVSEPRFIVGILSIAMASLHTSTPCMVLESCRKGLQGKGKLIISSNGQG